MKLTRRQQIAAATLATVAAAFVALDLTGSSLAEAHSGARGALGSLYRGSDAVVGPARRYLQALPNTASDSQRIRALEDENAKLSSQLAVGADNTRNGADLAALQLAAGTSGLTIVAGRVLAYGPAEGFEWTVTIDIGRTSGVAVDQTVTSAAGLVGRVLHADASTAVVLLAVDPGSGVGVRDVRSGELAVATGAGTSGYTLTPLSTTADLKVADQLETGPAGSSTFAAGLLLGTVTAVHTTVTATSSATVRAAITPTTLDLVGVITSAGSAAVRPPITGSR